jgi:hypothetical protein
MMPVLNILLLTKIMVKEQINLYWPNGTTSVPANVLLFVRAVQRLYRSVIPLLKAPSKHKFKTIVLFEYLEFFYWLLRLSEIDF